MRQLKGEDGMVKRKLLRNKQLLKETYLEYHGNKDDLDYNDIHEFLEELHNEGILDETEQGTYENLYYTGKCSADEYDYVVESMKLWNEDEYYRRLSIVNGY